MAVNTAELAESLLQDEIPIKLRCASCNKLVLNAFRLPCCDQNICEHCQESLPESCPVCMHTPLSSDDCKPNKALRLTVKAFLKNEEKKRSKEKAETSTPTPAPQTSSHATWNAPVTIPSVSTPVPSVETPHGTETAVAPPNNAKPDTEVDVKPETAPSSPSSSIEITLEAPDELESTQSNVGFGRPPLSQQNSFSNALVPRQSSQSGPVANQQSQEDESQGSGVSTQNDQQFQSQQQSQMVNPSPFGFGAMNGMGMMGDMNNMPNMGNFNSMMDMQNAMNAMNFAGFPNMMGMPGMGVDFMSMSSGMFSGFNGQSMGMDGMNSMNGMTNMSGMNGMSGFNDMGMGFNGGMNGWDGPSAMGMNGGFGGNFGANAGYYPSGGYNQQMHQSNFNQMNQPQFQMNSHRQNHHFNRPGHYGGFNRDHRGRGRGQWHHRHQHGQTNFQGSQATQQWHDSRISSSEAPSGVKVSDVGNSTPANVEDSTNNQQQQDTTLMSDVSQTDEHVQKNDDFPSDVQESGAEKNPVDQPNSIVAENQEGEGYKTGNQSELLETKPNGMGETEDDSAKPQPILTVDTSQDTTTTVNVSNSAVNDMQGPTMNAPRGPAAQLQYNPDFTFRGKNMARGFSRGTFDFRGGRFRGRGMGRYGHFVEQRFSGAETSSSVSLEPTGQGVQGAPTGPKAMREGFFNGSSRGRGQTIRGNATGGHVEQHQNSVSRPSPIETDESRPAEAADLRSRSSSGHRHGQESQSQSHNHSVEIDDSTSYPQIEEQSSNLREVTDGREQNYEDSHEDDSHTRNSSRDHFARHHSTRDRDKLRSSRHSRDHSRDRNRPRRQNRSPAGDSGMYAANGKSKRSRGHRSRSPDRERDKERDRHRHREDRHKHHSSRDEQTRSESMVPQREFKIKDRSKRTDLEVQKELVREENPDIDSHTLEREARNRERLLKEEQRRESLAGRGGGNSRKRSFGGAHNDDVDYWSSRRRTKDRQLSYHYEGEESNEARTSRVENEREAARWN